MSDDSSDAAGQALRAQLGRFEPRARAEAIEALEPHKVFPLLAYRLAQCGASEVLEALPSELRARLDGSLRQVRALNGLLLLSAASILRAASALDVRPVLLKGLLFADSYYPDPATRPMSDLDLLSAPGESLRLQEALKRAGFLRAPNHVVQAHAVAFENAQGVACDAHAYLEMYPQLPWSELEREVSLRRLRGVRVGALQSDVMLAHLIEHMHGHTRELGVVLLWLVDIVFVLRRHAHELSAAALRRLIVAPEVWVLCLRVLGLLVRCGETLPAGLLPLSSQIASVPLLTLEEVLRLRRTRPWGLPHPAGLLRLLAQSLRLRDYGQRAKPMASDLLYLPVDVLRARSVW